MITISAVPQSKDSFFYDDNLILQSVLNEAQDTALLATTCCPTRQGTVWILYQNVTTNASVLREYNLTTMTVVKTLNTALTLGTQRGAHSLIQLPNSDLLTCNRSTGDMISISPTDASVTHTYGLNISYFDAGMKLDGTKLAYVDGNILKQWDLTNDTALADIKDFGFPIIFPLWLSNDTFIIYTGVFNNFSSSDFQQIDSAGSLLNTYTNYHDFSGGGVRGVAASIGNDKLYIYGSDDFGSGDIFAIQEFVLSSGVAGSFTQLGPVGVSFPYFDITTGFAYIYESAISSMSINCSTSNITVNGTLFPSVPVVQVLFNGVTYTDFSVVSHSSTQIVIHINNFQNGQYGVAVS